MRRNFFKMLDMKRSRKDMQSTLEQKKVERTNFNEDSDQEDNDDFLFNPELMKLDDSEKPDTQMENI